MNVSFNTSDFVGALNKNAKKAFERNCSPLKIIAQNSQIEIIAIDKKKKLQTGIIIDAVVLSPGRVLLSHAITLYLMIQHDGVSKVSINYTYPDKCIKFSNNLGFVANLPIASKNLHDEFMRK